MESKTPALNNVPVILKGDKIDTHRWGAHTHNVVRPCKVLALRSYDGPGQPATSAEAAKQTSPGVHAFTALLLPQPNSDAKKRTWPMLGAGPSLPANLSSADPQGLTRSVAVLAGSAVATATGQGFT